MSAAQADETPRPVERHVPIEKLPGIPALARGLATGDPAVLEFLPDVPDLATIAARARLVLERFAPRAGAQVTPGLEESAAGKRAAVFTGQQVGLFTGPLLTLAKARAALGIAEDLERSGVPSSPAFWCASEDHDLAEVTRFVLPGPAGPHDEGPDPATLAGNRKPVGSLPIELDVAALLDRAVAAAGKRDDEAYAALRAASEGRTFLDAFTATLGWLFAGTRLAPVDAARLPDKRELVPLAARLVRERAEVKALLGARAKRLVEAGHPLQVTGDPDALPLFVRVDGDRWLLREEKGRLALKGHPEGLSYEPEEVVEALEAGRFVPSFSALTRPLSVSILYPVAAQVLGPAEIAYWAQSLPLFAWAGLVPPVLVPRPMAAVIEPQSRRLLQKLSLSIEEVLEGPDAILNARGAREAAGLLGRVEAVRAEAVARLEALRPELLGVDESLAKAVDQTREKVELALSKLEEKSASAAGRSHETLTKQVERLTTALAPHGALAERLYTPVTYLMTLGREGLTSALSGLRWDVPGLQVLEP